MPEPPTLPVGLFYGRNPLVRGWVLEFFVMLNTNYIIVNSIKYSLLHDTIQFTAMQ